MKFSVFKSKNKSINEKVVEHHLMDWLLITLKSSRNVVLDIILVSVLTGISSSYVLFLSNLWLWVLKGINCWVWWCIDSRCGCMLGFCAFSWNHYMLMVEAPTCKWWIKEQQHLNCVFCVLSCFVLFIDVWLCWGWTEILNMYTVFLCLRSSWMKYFKKSKSYGSMVPFSVLHPRAGDKKHRCTIYSQVCFHWQVMCLRFLQRCQCIETGVDIIIQKHKRSEN